MSHFAVSAVGRDRPGIVADVSQALVELGAEIDDCEMSMLRGHMSVMLLVSGPTELGHEEMEERLAPLSEQLGLDAITVSNLAEVHEHETGDAPPTHAVRVFGVDQPGILHSVSRRLADDGVSITGMKSNLIGERGSEAIHTMDMEVTVPAGVDATTLASDLEEIGNASELEVSLVGLP